MNDKTQSQERAGGEIEFYVPATFQFSTESGAIERVIVGVFGDRNNLEARITTEEPTKEFYRLNRASASGLDPEGEARQHA